MFDLACSNCGKCGCQCGKLPFTMSVQFSGLENKTHGNNCDLSFSSNFGSGAAGVAMSAGGCNGDSDPICGRVETKAEGGCKDKTTYSASDRGPIASVLLTEPGSCYARLGRVAPTLAASASPGIGATFSVSLAQKQESGTNFDYWEISSISATGGAGYINGSPVVVTRSVGDTVVTEPSIKLKATRLEPLVTATVGGGTGATLSVSVASNGGSPETWRISNISVKAGGSGYAQGAPVSLALGENVIVEQAASATANVIDGAVTSVVIANGGKYYKAGAANGVTITTAGKYYREDETASPYVADLKVTPCGGGADAKISATIDTKTTSDTFGQVTGLTVDDGGSDYLTWGWINTCRGDLNGKNFVLRATSPYELTSLAAKSCFGSGFCGRIVPVGNRTEPCVRITGAGTGGSITQTVSKKYEDDREQLPYWTIDSVSASGGEKYPDSGAATINLEYGATSSVAPSVTLTASSGSLTGATVNDGGKFYIQYEYDGTPTPIKKVEVINKGSGYAVTGRGSPSITVSKNDQSLGASAVFTPTLKNKKNNCGIDYWVIESISVSGDGSCFGTAGRTQPTLQASVSGGTGASLSVKTASAKDGCGATYWYISSISVTGGTGYVNDSPVTITSSGYEEVAAAATLQADKTTGIPSGVTVSSGGRYYIPGPQTESLKITLNTPDDKEESKASLLLYADGGKASKVEVLNGGRYYRESKSLAPYVADVNIFVDQASGSAGSGAKITPTIDADPNSGTFGQITKLTIDEPGSNYTLYGGPKDCSYYGPCGIGLKFRGLNKEPEVTLADAVYRADDKVGNCNTLPYSATLLHSAGEGSVSLSSGGVWNDKRECPCDPSGCTPVPPTRCGEPPTCPPCNQKCDACNECPYGCGCKNQNCEPCKDTCSEGSPCGEGCHCINGKCRPGKCGCGFLGMNAPVSMTATVEVKVPEAIQSGECSNGPYNATFPLTPGFEYSIFGGRKEIQLQALGGRQGEGFITVLIFCLGNEFRSYAFFHTYPLGANPYYNWSCLISQISGVGLIGFGTVDGVSHGSAEVDGFCVPAFSNGGEESIETYNAGMNVTIKWDVQVSHQQGA